MVNQAGTAVLEAPEFAGLQRTQLQDDADQLRFDPFDMFDAQPEDSRLEPCEFGTA